MELFRALNPKSYLLLGGSGFIGTNLALRLALDPNITVRVACRYPEKTRALTDFENIELVRAEFDSTCDFASLVQGIDVVVHMVSTTVPGNPKQSIPDEFEFVSTTAKLLDSCISANSKRVVFISSGGTVYGKGQAPFNEDDPVWPISSYGLQKATLEKLMHLYGHLYGLDYRIVRPSNPYGPYQNAHNGQGVIAAFINAAITNQDLLIFGDGSVVRDFIYIDDMVEGLLKVMAYDGPLRVFNLGSGYGVRIIDVAQIVLSLVFSQSKIRFIEGRGIDVPESILDMTRFNTEIGPIQSTNLEEGILHTIRYQEAFSERLFEHLWV